MPHSAVLLYVYPIPSLQISSLTQLSYLALDNNRLTGSIPSSVSINNILKYSGVMLLNLNSSMRVHALRFALIIL